MILFALLLGMMAFVIWYVIDRRTKLRSPGNPAEHGVSGTNTGPAAAGNGVPAATEPAAAQSPAARVIVPPPAPVVPVAAPPTPAASPVDLTQHDGQTIDFSSGTPAVKDTAEDRAAIEQAVKDMAEAVKGVTFGPPAKKAEPLPPEPAKP